MKIRMKVSISGTHDGVPWPNRGDVVELPDDEAAQLCAAGHAEPVADPAADVETTTVDADVETRQEPEGDTDLDEAEDVDVLRVEAAELGLKVHHNAKAETIRRQIDEALLAEGTESS